MTARAASRAAAAAAPARPRANAKRARATTPRVQPHARAIPQGRLEQRVLGFVTLGLVAFGLVMVFSATSTPAALANSDPMTFLTKQAIYAFGGIVLLAVLSRIDYHRLRRLTPMFLVGAFGLCAAVLVIAPPINGARRWFIVGPVSVQPSELAKLALCLWVCARLSRRPVPKTMSELMKPIGFVCAAFCALIILQPDLGTTIALVLMVAGVLVVSGVPSRLLVLSGTLTLALGGAAIWYQPYRRARFFSFLNASQDPQGTGYQITQAKIGLASGGYTGLGLGHGVTKSGYLPEAHTDMILAIIGEELGLIGLTLLVAAFVLFAWAGFRVALACRDPFGKRLAAGITTLVCGQAVINIAAVLGVAPLTGIPLPFVSYGGSSLIVLLAAVGILLNIAVNGRVVEARVRDRSRGNSRARPARARSR